MSRNQNRLLGQEFPEETNNTQSDEASVPSFLGQAFGAAPQQGSPLEFVVPTEHVELPSRGLYYPDGHPLKGAESVEIRYMTAKEEDILTSQNLIKKGIVLDRLAHSVLLDKRIDPSHLLVGDKAAILVAARITGYGGKYTARVLCPSCVSPQQYEFDLQGLPVHHGGIEAVQDADVKPSELGIGVFSVALLNTPAVRFHLKLITGVDEQRISAINEKKKKHNISDGLLMTQFESIIAGVEYNGRIVQSKGDIQTILGSLPAVESRHLRSVYNKLTPTIVLERDFVCESCGEENKIDVPVNPDFFWPKNK